MDKATNKHLIEIADKVLKTKNCPLFRSGSQSDIMKEYNGQVSAFGVSVLMTGLKPTVSIYFQDKQSHANKPYRKAILMVLVEMLNEYKPEIYSYENLEKFVRGVFCSKEEDALKTDIVNCSVALKQVIRTYNLIESCAR